MRNTVMLRLRKFNRLCSSNVSDTANRLRKTRKKKSSVVPPFRSGHMSAICARLSNKGKVGVQRGRETMGVPSSLLPRRVPQSPTASAAVPRCATTHSSPRNGEPFTRFGHTGKSVPRNLRSKSARRSALLTFSLVQCRKMRYTYFI